MKTNIWITGAYGFIGRHVARTLADQENNIVFGVGHGQWSHEEYRQWGISGWINGGINLDSLNSLYTLGGRPDVVIHLAGGSSVGMSLQGPRTDFFRTVVSTENLLEWLRVNSPETAVVVVSSAAVYGAGFSGTISESSTLNPYSPYGHHKLMMESLCHSYANSFGIRSVVARLFSVFGVGLQKQLLWDISKRINDCAGTLVLSGTGNELRDWVNVLDVSQVLAKIGAYASTMVPIINVGSGIGTSVRDIAQLFIDNWHGSHSNETLLSFTGITREGDPVSLIADTHYLKELGLQCASPVADGIKNYVAWCLDYNSLTSNPVY